MCLVLLAAVFANSIDLKCVPGGEVMVSAPDLLFQLADLGGEELDRAPAIGADHVVMATPVVLMFVAGDPVVEGDFARKATFGEQLQSPVNGGVSDASVFLLHQAVQLVSGKMVASFKECAQDDVALGGLFEADALEVLVKNVLRLAHHLARDAGLIVDAFSQHEKRRMRAAGTGYHLRKTI